MDWTPEDDAAFAQFLPGNEAVAVMRFCQNYRMGRAGGEPLRKIDYEDYEKVFRGAGMSSRDIELIRPRDQMYGTRQTFAGLTCSLGYIPEVNKSFYRGIGHRWQVVLPGYNFVYLEGDGTATGMRVTGWN
jgi:hypothetical protein